eukprot:9071193-Ditylum_brightwellii.AAC.1
MPSKQGFFKQSIGPKWTIKIWNQSTKFEQKGECYAIMDLGGELSKHPEVNLLLQQHGYNVRPTAPDASYQNAPGKRLHQTIANVIRAMLEGANLPEKY